MGGVCDLQDRRSAAAISERQTSGLVPNTLTCRKPHQLVFADATSRGNAADPIPVALVAAVTVQAQINGGMTPAATRPEPLASRRPAS